MPRFDLKCKKCSYSKEYELNRFVDKEGLTCEECGGEDLARDFRKCRIIISDVYMGDTCNGMEFSTQKERDGWCKQNDKVRISNGEAMQEQAYHKKYKDKKDKEDFKKSVLDTTVNYMKEKGSI